MSLSSLLPMAELEGAFPGCDLIGSLLPESETGGCDEAITVTFIIP